MGEVNVGTELIFRATVIHSPVKSIWKDCWEHNKANFSCPLALLMQGQVIYGIPLQCKTTVSIWPIVPYFFLPPGVNFNLHYVLNKKPEQLPVWQNSIAIQGLKFIWGAAVFIPCREIFRTECQTLQGIGDKEITPSLHLMQFWSTAKQTFW